MQDDAWCHLGPLGIPFLTIHPANLLDDDDYLLLALAADWADGRLPERGGVMDQASATVSAIRTINGAMRLLQKRKGPRRG